MPFLPSARSPHAARDGALFALAAMFFAQLGIAGAVRFLDALGPQGATALRLTWAALFVIAIVRPWKRRYTKAAVLAGLVLGVATAGMSLTYMAAAMRIPLGTAGAIEFLGALAVATFTAHRRYGWVWPLLAAVGVALLTRPWEGVIDPVGVAFAVAAACCYAGYILLTQRIGDLNSGIEGLAISLPVAALISAAVGAPSSIAHLTPQLIGIGLVLAISAPFIPFACEMLSLQRLNASAFSTLLCLQPGFGLLLGMLLLGQMPGILGAVGMVCVITAGIMAVRHGSRESAATLPPRSGQAPAETEGPEPESEGLEPAG